MRKIVARTIAQIALCFALGFLATVAVADDAAPFPAPGFIYLERSGPTYTFFCMQPSSGREGVVSYQLQPGGKPRIGRAKTRRIGQMQLFEIEMFVTAAGRTPRYRVSGYLLGGQKTISLISSSAEGAPAQRSFDNFARKLTTLFSGIAI